jgi:hypothetical protein
VAKWLPHMAKGVAEWPDFFWGGGGGVVGGWGLATHWALEGGLLTPWAMEMACHTQSGQMVVARPPL